MPDDKRIVEIGRRLAAENPNYPQIALDADGPAQRQLGSGETPFGTFVPSGQPR